MYKNVYIEIESDHVLVIVKPRWDKIANTVQVKEKRIHLGSADDVLKFLEGLEDEVRRIRRQLEEEIGWWRARGIEF